MASVNFLYRSTKENESLTVRLLFRNNEKDFVFGANSKVFIYDRKELLDNPKLSSKDFWQLIKKGTQKKDISFINKRNELNDKLNRLEIYILEAFDKIGANNISKEWLESVIDEFHNPNANNEIPNTLSEFIDYYIKSRPELKYGTSKKFITIKNKIDSNAKLFGNAPILLKDIDDNFRLKFQTIFSDYNQNTIIRDLGEIKTLCRYAFDKGKEINKEVLKWKFKLNKTSFVYLNEDDLRKIENTTGLPEYLENAKDWLIISAYTGQRISDFMRFDKSMIRIEKNKQGKQVHLIEFTQVKTNTTIAVPLHQKVIEILNKRNGEFPRQVSDQKYNDYIKDVCREANINELVKGSLMVETKPNSGIFRKKFGTYKKWELVSSHIGRRSFASNNFGKIPTRLLMSATGHAKEEMFLKYIGKTQTETAKELADWF